MSDPSSSAEEIANLRYSSASVLVAPLSNGSFAIWSFLHPNGPIGWDVTYASAERLAEAVLTASRESQERAAAFHAARPSSPVKAPHPGPREFSIEDLF